MVTWRVHGANVTGINHQKGVVMVEWVENAATKGKEVDFGELIRLNTDLFEYMNSVEVLPLKENVDVQKNNSRQTISRIPAPPVFSQRSYSLRRSVQTKPTTPQQVHETENKSLSPAVSKVSFPNSSARQKSTLVQQMEKMKSKQETNKAKNTEIRAKRAKECGVKWEFQKMIEEFRDSLEYTPLSFSDSSEDHRICVCVRKRPLNKKEIAKKEIDVITIPEKGLLLLHEPKQKVDLTKYLDNQTFRLDYSFDDSATNEMVYRFTARPLVQKIFEGSMATCFAYGQTGSGKTHTMGGDFCGKSQNSSKGIYAFAARDVFMLLSQPRYSILGLEPYVSFFEIYNGKVFDLLNKKAKLRVLEDGKQQVHVVGLQERQVASAEDVIKVIDIGSACRTSGQTFANSSSSRSHAILQIVLRRRGNLHGKFSLVDLAGNERGADVCSSDRQTLVEGAEINRSLLALKECIRALGHNQTHTPFRMSKLTQVLRDSFIGENSRTCMIAMISPGINSCEYTLNTLRYADRVKELKETSNGSNSESSDKEDIEDGEESNAIDKDTVLSKQMTSFYDAMSCVSELEEKVVEEFQEMIQRGMQVLKMVEQPSYDLQSVVTRVKEVLMEAMALQENMKSLESAMVAEEKASSHLKNRCR
ncbi:kinesin-like protein KIF2C isoform X3 [Polyodon spathula]|uniref:kinesin-like protein KIF2C isoform X3 n=1 Tax=Polyodon spathula TaxID=7913 RepID=UPI001B7E18D2|nr:kinesin-like protein KIF2C isoform X3 [Polyodon spathula]XP_041133123.1 kinesin-like protein KIF2C isoform X3 [Polyodon spathula]XP_041133124.1 kinesin-like protein KIF2C isoform X3 [Polyodon spathula]